MTADLASLDPWAAMLMGASLGPYVLVEHLNAGHFGHVFEAEHSHTRARFALKVLKLNPSAATSTEFVNEAVLLRQLSGCDGIIKFVDEGVGRVELQVNGGMVMPVDVQYLVLSRASGSVDELILDPIARGELSALEKLRLWRDVVKAVRQMHGLGIAHRDLKCSNCLLMVSGNFSSVKLADLGRSKDLAHPPARMAEEYLFGRGDMRFAPPEFLYLLGDSSSSSAISSDYYGIGSILVELFTGQSLTSIVMGDLNRVIEQAKADYLAGRSRDPRILVGRYRSVIADVVELMPLSIRTDVSTLLNQMCHPDPTERSLPSPYRRDRLDRDQLHWILKRVDIMIKQLEIEMRMERRSNQMERRSA